MNEWKRVQNEFQVLGQREEVPSLNYNRDAIFKKMEILEITNFILNS